MKKDLTTQEWYQSLVEDCQSIITESVFTSRWTLIKGYHLLGMRILEENDNFERSKIYGKKICSQVSNSLGKSRQTIQRAVQFATKYPDLDSLPEGKNITWHKICNNLLPEAKKEKVVLPMGKYGVLYIDPPWKYPERLDAKNLYGNANYHYDTMSVKELCDLPVKDLGAENSVLFMWVATNFLEESFKIFEAWGYNYKSQMAWVKEGKKWGIGYYFRGGHELLLVATRGSYLPKEQVSSVLMAPKQEHSRKPEEVYDIIEKMYPDDKYIELFLRGEPRNNKWTGWGNEAK